VAVPVCPGTIEIRLGRWLISALHVHCVFAAKNRQPLLVGEIKERFWAFMGGIAKQNEKKHGIEL
jgi:REP element-mobilizing transposase RayT